MLRPLSLLFGILLLLYTHSFTQRIVNIEYLQSGSIRLASDIEIPKINSGYTIWMPEASSLKGLIVFTHQRRDTLNADDLIEYALSKDLGIMYATTENRLEFLFEFSKMDTLLGYIRSAINNYNIPGDAILYCGMSLEGTRALKLAIYGSSLEADLRLVPRAVVICDAPLDMVRFHNSMKRAYNLDFHPSASNEGKWVSSHLEKNLGGPPELAMEKYLAYSPFVYNNSVLDKLLVFNEISVRAYTEPDVNWWIATRRKDYYDMNAIDLASWINKLKISGNKDASLILTNNKGYLPNGSKHPHSWSIVDEREMIDWFVNILDSN